MSRNHRINLHTHSMFSDGTLWPEPLVERAQQVGLTHLALTDHDSMAGVDRFLRACRKAHLVGIPGVEVDCVAPEIGFDMELLGYFPEGDFSNTMAFAELRRQDREAKMKGYIETARRLHGDAISMSGLRQHKAGGPGYEKEKVSFNKVDLWSYLKTIGTIPTDIPYREFKNGPIYRDAEPADKPHVHEVIAVIRSDGGRPVLPHPGHLFGDSPSKMRQRKDELDQKLAFFKKAGVFGVELYYYPADHIEINEWVRRASAKHGFKHTFGSDCHGPGSAKDTLECFFGDTPLDWQWN